MTFSACRPYFAVYKSVSARQGATAAVSFTWNEGLLSLSEMHTWAQCWIDLLGLSANRPPAEAERIIRAYAGID